MTGSIARFLATFLLVASPAFAQADQTLRVRLNSDIRSTDPGTNRDNNTDEVMLHIVEGLVAYREDVSIGPMLADSFTISPDGKTYRFTLRDGVTFHNGAPLTAAEVAWTWKRFLDPATQWRCLPDFDGRGVTKLLAVEAPDPKTVVFTFEKPSALILANMARPDCGGGGILHPDSLGPDGKWRSPVGTGPFRWGEWRRDQYVELTRFDKYAARSEPRTGLTGNKTAGVARLRFLIVPDGNAAKAALLGGGLDNVDTLSAADLGDIQARKDIQVDIHETMGLNAILFQTNDPLLKDVRIRQALALCIDYPELVASVSEDRSKPNNSLIPSSSAFQSAATRTPFKHDPDRARALLKEAGYRGQPIRMLATRRYMSIFNQAVVAQAMAEQVGLKIDIDVVDWATMIDRFDRGDFQLMSFSYGARLDPSLSMDVVIGSKTVSPRKLWEDPDAIRQLAASMQTADPAARQTIFDALHLRMLEEVPIIPLYNAAIIAGTRANATGYLGWPAEMPRYWGVALK